MLSIDQNNRPNVTVLMTHPFISLRIMEKQVRDRHAQVKMDEKNIKEKEQNIINKAL